MYWYVIITKGYISKNMGSSSNLNSVFIIDF